MGNIFLHTLIYLNNLYISWRKYIQELNHDICHTRACSRKKLSAWKLLLVFIFKLRSMCSMMSRWGKKNKNHLLVLLSRMLMSLCVSVFFFVKSYNFHIITYPEPNNRLCRFFDKKKKYFIINITLKYVEVTCTFQFLLEFEKHLICNF